MSGAGPAPRPRVVAVDLRRVALRLRHPHRAAHGVEHDREVVLARVELEDGAHGWGECSALRDPGYTHEHLAGAWVALVGRLGPALLAGTPTSGAGQPMAEAALLDAVLDATTRRAGTSLASALGAAPRPVATATVISVSDSIDDVVAAVAAATGPVKLKVAPGWDVEPLRAVRRSFPDRLVAVDANGSYEDGGVDDGLARLAMLDALGPWYVEQPMRSPAASAAAAERLVAPVCLDESIGSLRDAEGALAHGALEILNVKPARVGGILVAAELVAWAQQHGVDAFVGGMLETGVGRAGALAVAQLEGCTLPTDLGPSSRYWVEDLTDAVVADGRGRLVPPSGPGLGVEPIAARLDDVTVDRVVLR